MRANKSLIKTAVNIFIHECRVLTLRRKLGVGLICESCNLVASINQFGIWIRVHVLLIGKLFCSDL